MKLKETNIVYFQVAFAVLFQETMSVADDTLNLLNSSGIVSDDIKKLLNSTLQVKTNDTEEIASVLKNWKLDRLAFIDKSIIFFAVAKMKYLDIDVKTAIQEAVELSSIFSEKKSPKFVNGVLDAWYNKYKKEA